MTRLFLIALILLSVITSSWAQSQTVSAPSYSYEKDGLGIGRIVVSVRQFPWISLGASALVPWDFVLRPALVFSSPVVPVVRGYSPENGEWAFGPIFQMVLEGPKPSRVSLEAGIPYIPYKESPVQGFFLVGYDPMRKITDWGIQIKLTF